MRKEAKRWWEKSQEDIETARILIDNEKFSEEAFFLQQAVEKGLKSFLIEKSDKFPKIHDLVSLGTRADLPDNLLSRCKKISPAYIYTRYPNVVESSELEEKIDDFVEGAKEVLEWAEKKI